MNDFIIVQVLDTRYQLSANLFDSIDGVRATVVFQVLIEVTAFEEFHDNMAVMVLVNWIKGPNEVLVGDDVRMAQIFGDAELSVELTSLYPSQVDIVVDPASFVNEVSFDARKPYLIYRG